MDTEALGNYASYGAFENSPTNKKTHTAEIIQEYEHVIRATFPLAVSFFLQYLLSVTTIFAAGRLGPKELAAATLASSTFTVTGLATYQGMSTCLDSLCSQSYGAGKYMNVGMYFQRCSILELCITIFLLGPIWWNSEYILKYIAADQEIILMALKYLRITTFGAPGLLLFETGKRFLQAQQIYSAGTFTLVFVAVINIGFNWLLVWNEKTNIGFIGAPISLVISYWIMPIIMLLFVTFIGGKECWNGFHLTESMSNWSPLLHLALPGFIMTEAEYIACQLINFLAAHLSANEFAAQSITSNVGFLAFQLSFSLSVAVGSRLGYFVGRKSVHNCKLLVWVAISMGFGLSVFNFAIIFFNRHRLGSIFTSSKEVLEISDHILIYSATNQISDVLNVIAAGVLRGQGRQKLGSILTLLAYYTVSLPVGYYFGIIKKLNLAGLWIGYIVGVIVLAGSELWVVYNSNWREIFLRTSEH